MTTDLRTTLAAADPVRRDRYADAELIRRSRDILAAADEIVASVGAGDELVVVPGAPGPRPHRSRRRTAGALAAAAVLVGAVAVVPTLVGRTSNAHRQAAALLEDAADAITATDPTTRAGQYWQITSVGFSLAQAGGNPPAAVLIAQARTSYVPVDGARPTVVVTQPAKLVEQLVGSPADAAPLLEGAAPIGISTVPPHDASTPPTWHSPTPAFLAALPRDPAALADRIRTDTKGEGNSVDGEVVVTVADVLASGLVPADLRAALYRVLAAVPGVEVTAQDATVNGISGVAFAYREDANGIRQELVVDPDDGVLVGEREIATRALDGIAVGTVIGETAFTRALVDAVPSRVQVGPLSFTCVTRNGSLTCSG